MTIHRSTIVLTFLLALGRPALGNETKTIPTPSGSVQIYQKTVEPIPQTFTALTEAELSGIRSNAALARDFVRGYVPATNYALSDFDKAFSAWQQESPQRYTSDEVIAILGAYLGEQLVSDQDMEWTVVTDSYGQDLAVRSRKVEVVSFPFSSVTKRVERNQFNFMEGIYFVVQEAIRNGDLKAR
jgi:hypothetical protein